MSDENAGSAEEDPIEGPQDDPLGEGADPTEGMRPLRRSGPAGERLRSHQDLSPLPGIGPGPGLEGLPPGAGPVSGPQALTPGKPGGPVLGMRGPTQGQPPGAVAGPGQASPPVSSRPSLAKKTAPAAPAASASAGSAASGSLLGKIVPGASAMAASGRPALGRRQIGDVGEGASEGPGDSEGLPTQEGLPGSAPGPGQGGLPGPGTAGSSSPVSGTEGLARKVIDGDPRVRAATAAASAVGLGGAVNKAKDIGAKLATEAIKKNPIGRAASTVVDTAAKAHRAFKGGPQTTKGSKHGRKVAVPLVSIVVAMAILGGGMFAIQGSGGAAALMGPEGTAYAMEKAGEARVNESLRMAEFYSWSTGEPAVPWELVGGIEGVASKYGNRVEGYRNEPTARSGPDAPPGSQTYPVVYPPIVGDGGVGPFLVNPKHLQDNETSARDVYENCTAIRGAIVAQPQSGEFPDVANGESALIVTGGGTSIVTGSSFPWLKSSPKTCKNGVSNTSGGSSSGGSPVVTVTTPGGGSTATTAAPGGGSTATTVAGGATTTTARGLLPNPLLPPPLPPLEPPVNLPMTPIAFVTAQVASTTTTTTRPGTPATLPQATTTTPPPTAPPATRPEDARNPTTSTAPPGTPTTVRPTTTTVRPTTTVFVPPVVSTPGGGGGPVNADKAVAPRSPANYPLIDPQDSRAEALYVMHQLKTRAYQVFACFNKEGFPKTGAPPSNAKEEDLQCWDYDPALTKKALGWLTPAEQATSTTSSTTPPTTAPGTPEPRKITDVGDLEDLRLTGAGIEFWKALLKDIVGCPTAGSTNAANLPKDPVVVLKTACTSGTDVIQEIMREAWKLGDVDGYAALAKSQAGCASNGSVPVSADLEPATLEAINALKGVYEEAGNAEGISWTVLAALDYRENNNDPNRSTLSGEVIGTTNPDSGTVTSSKADSAQKAAAHIKAMASWVYGVEVNVSTGGDDIKKAFISYNRGTSYKTAGLPPDDSPYVMNQYDAEHNDMVFPNIPGETLAGMTDHRYGAFTIFVRLGGGTANPGCAPLSGNGIVAIAQQQVGLREIPDGCNCGPEIEKFLGSAATSLSDPDRPWCAMFVSWVYREAGVPFTGGQDGGYMLWGVTGVVAWFRANAIWEAGGTGTPSPGDAIAFGDEAHVGLIERVEGDMIYTIEGNSGNAVSRREYQKSDPWVMGYGRLTTPPPATAPA